MTQAETERLALLIEECGECLQVAGKILRHTYNAHPPDTPGETNRDLLEQEIADVLVAIQLLNQEDDINGNNVDFYTEEKQRNVNDWLIYNRVELIPRRKENE